MKKDIKEVMTLASIKETVIDTGDCITCNDYLGRAPDGYCRTGNDTKRACCCFHSGYDEPERISAKKALENIA